MSSRKTLTLPMTRNPATLQPYVLQFLLLPVLLREGFVATLLSNTLYAAAFAWCAHASHAHMHMHMHTCTHVHTYTHAHAHACMPAH